MRLDRQLGIALHLLRRPSASASELARRFEVSRRTIQRDIDALCAAGIPITAQVGSRGGYSIPESYRMDAIVRDDDRAWIVTALRALWSAYRSDAIESTLDKALAAAPPRAGHLFLDFDVLAEQRSVNDMLPVLDAAIRDRARCRFSYTDARGAASERRIEPLALAYRWYAWYVLGYCLDRQDYRLFKLVRMEKLERTGMPFTRAHGDAATLLARCGHPEGGMLRVELRCDSCCRAAAREYLKGTIVEEGADGSFVMHMDVVESERMWWALLLSFGDRVEVLSPAALRERLRGHARAILGRYGEG